MTDHADAGMKPLPCPFCGSELEHSKIGENTTIWRHSTDFDCQLSGSRFGDFPPSVERWNRRAPSGDSEGTRADRKALDEIIAAYDSWATGASAPDFDTVSDDLGRLCDAIQEAEKQIIARSAPLSPEREAPPPKVLEIARAFWRAGYLSGAIDHDLPRTHHESVEAECDTCAAYYRKAERHLHWPDASDELVRQFATASPEPETRP